MLRLVKKKLTVHKSFFLHTNIDWHIKTGNDVLVIWPRVSIKSKHWRFLLLLSSHTTAMHHHRHHIYILKSYILKECGLSTLSPFSPRLCARIINQSFIVNVVFDPWGGGVTRRQRRPGRGGRRTPWRRGWGRGWRDRSRLDTSSAMTALYSRRWGRRGAGRWPGCPGRWPPHRWCLQGLGTLSQWRAQRILAHCCW